jgi:ABC-2 type transport system ATP-binding protein
MNLRLTSISANSLCVDRSGNSILKDINLNIQPKRILGLLGPSGSGKTTLMRTIAGLQFIKSGDVSVLGFPSGSLELRSRIAYSTQSASVYVDLTCIENLNYFASLHNESEMSVEEILEEVGLTKNRTQLARTLSGGELARLALATTLVGKPEVLILDEPTVGLDPLLRNQLWKLFADLAMRDKTIIVSSHVMEEADMCDDLILMRNGKILAAGTPQELRDQTGQSKMESVFISLVETK